MGKVIDLTDQIFGRLKVIEYIGKDKYNNAMWSCECICKNVTILRSATLKSGHTQSCGCLAKEKTIIRNTKHGYYNSKTYHSWRCMIRRCYDINNPSYKYYGGRSIRVCKRWLKFENFLKDMGEKPKGTSIDRIDNKSNYKPDNCRWATIIEQANNKTTNLYFQWENKKQSVKMWCRELNINSDKVYKRIENGWSIKEALELIERKK